MSGPYVSDHHARDPVDRDRRRLLVAGLGLAAASLLPSVGSGQSGDRVGSSAPGEPSKGSLPRPTRIGVIGAGWLGGTVGRLW